MFDPPKESFTVFNGFDGATFVMIIVFLVCSMLFISLVVTTNVVNQMKKGKHEPFNEDGKYNVFSNRQINEVFFIHEADSQSQPVVITIFTHVFCPSLLFKIPQNKLQVKIVIATDVAVGLAERITDDSYLAYLLDDNGKNPDTKPKKHKLNPLDKIGVEIETLFTRGFTRWGIFCAEYPIPVIVISLTTACILCAGLHWLKVTTDPVELWSGPGTKSRIEKDFYDSTFRPFFRTNQVIVKVREDVGLEKVR